MTLFEEKFQDACTLSREGHSEQSYDGGPYTDHLYAVQQVLIRFGYNPNGSGSPEHIKLSEDLSIAAILHDIVEDTSVTLSDIRDRFGDDIASLVDGVTNEDGVNRKERHQKTYPKTKRIPNAFTLKLADRIANVEKCLATESNLLQMYRKEWSSFQEEFDGYVDRLMWKYLKRLMGS